MKALAAKGLSRFASHGSLPALRGGSNRTIRATMRRLLDLPARIVHGGHGESFDRAWMREIAQEYLDRGSA